jgi:mRNA interferase MazF
MTVSKGEIWLANLNPQKRPNEVGKTRPVLVLQGDTLNHSEYGTVIVMPLSTQRIDDAEPLRMRVKKRGALREDSDLLIAQVRAIDKSRFVEKLGALEPEELEKAIRLFNDILE